MRRGYLAMSLHRKSQEASPLLDLEKTVQEVMPLSAVVSPFVNRCVSLMRCSTGRCGG
jgi:hypothetical protein